MTFSLAYPIDLDWNSSCGTVLGIVLLKLYATTGSSTPNAPFKCLILATGVTYRNHSPTISRAELTSNAAQDALQDLSGKAFHQMTTRLGMKLSFITSRKWNPSLRAINNSFPPSLTISTHNSQSLSNSTPLGHVKLNKYSEHRYHICRIYSLQT